jgi:hypothetical protein
MGLSLMIFGPDELVYWREFRAGEALKERVEMFRCEKGRLPKESEVDRDGLHYEPCDDGTYLIWFGTALGQSRAYEPLTGEWADYNPGCSHTHFDI